MEEWLFGRFPSDFGGLFFGKHLVSSAGRECREGFEEDKVKLFGFAVSALLCVAIEALAADFSLCLPLHQFCTLVS